MDANKIKFVDDDGSVEVLEPPMTARTHVETPTEELIPQETIEEEHAADPSGDILNTVEEDILENVVVQKEIQELVEHNIKELEKIESVIKNPEFYPTEEQKIDDVNEEQKSGEDNIDKEALSLVANAINDVRAKESALITPTKGCCILQ